MSVPSEMKNANELGNIQIAPEVIEIIAGLATIEVPGVAGMSGGVVGGIAELLGKKNFSKGIKVEVGQKETAVDVSVIVKYGSSIPEVASAIQDSVKREIENMTGLTVVEVNVQVQGVDFRQEEKKEVKKEEEYRVK